MIHARIEREIKWWECVNKARSTTGCPEEGRGAAALHWVKPLVCGNQKGLLSMGGKYSRQSGDHLAR